MDLGAKFYWVIEGEAKKKPVWHSGYLVWASSGDPKQKGCPV